MENAAVMFKKNKKEMGISGNECILVSEATPSGGRLRRGHFHYL